MSFCIKKSIVIRHRLLLFYFVAVNQQMAEASINHNTHFQGDIWSNDIWSQKARQRMSTARERKSLNFTESMSAGK